MYVHGHPDGASLLCRSSLKHRLARVGRFGALRTTYDPTLLLSELRGHTQEQDGVTPRVWARPYPPERANPLAIVLIGQTWQHALPRDRGEERYILVVGGPCFLYQRSPDDRRAARLWNFPRLDFESFRLYYGESGHTYCGVKDEICMLCSTYQ